MTPLCAAKAVRSAATDMKKAASKVRDEKLLAAVRDRPVLYDQSMHVFKDYGAKNAAWREVATAVVGSQDKQAGQLKLYVHTRVYFIILIYFWDYNVM